MARTRARDCVLCTVSFVDFKELSAGEPEPFLTRGCPHRKVRHPRHPFERDRRQSLEPSHNSIEQPAKWS